MELVYCVLVEVAYGYAVGGSIGVVHHEITVVGCYAVAERAVCYFIGFPSYDQAVVSYAYCGYVY